MTEERWKALMSDDCDLTPDEIALGWHFCWDWDGLLIGPEMGEIVHCTCDGVPNKDQMVKDAEAVMRSDPIPPIDISDFDAIDLS